MRLQLDRLPSPIGMMLVVFDGEARLRALHLDDDEPRLRRMLTRYYGTCDLAAGRAPAAIAAPLDAYFNGELNALDAIPVMTAGTPFQRRVWAALRTIPPRATTSYGELAASIGAPGASRAVGLANGANPVAVVVPCHRVIGANGSLTGYGGGLHRKHWLLAHEGAILA
jgi:methylated-DNA-[protein]-cysteine S-methyltransferase